MAAIASTTSAASCLARLVLSLVDKEVFAMLIKVARSIFWGTLYVSRNYMTRYKPRIG